MKPEDATRLCIEALRNVRGLSHTAIDSKNVRSALESGDLRIVSGARLAALEKAADAGRPISSGYAPLGEALAELDALDGGEDP